jgi:hypothetical protein
MDEGTQLLNLNALNFHVDVAPIVQNSVSKLFGHNTNSLKARMNSYAYDKGIPLVW